MTNNVLPDHIAEAIVEPKAYGQWDALQDGFTWARANMPVGLVQTERYDPFWAITRHADIMEISRNNARFASAVKSPVLVDRAVDDLARSITPNNDGHLIRSLVQMDAPDHMKHRLLTQSWFMPKNLRTIEARIREIAKATVEKMLMNGGKVGTKQVVPKAFVDEMTRPSQGLNPNYGLLTWVKAPAASPNYVKRRVCWSALPRIC